MASKYLKADALIALLILILAVGTSGFAAERPQPAPASKLDDATVAAIFDEVNTADIWAARVAVRKGSSEQVRAFARMVVQDHEQVQQMARELTRKQGIVPTPPVHDSTANDLVRTLDLLESKSGLEFDRSFLEHEIAFHQAAVQAVKKSLLPAIQDPEFKAFVQKVLPGFEHHVEAVSELAEKLGYRKTSPE
jgi:putative membrane protein